MKTIFSFRLSLLAFLMIFAACENPFQLINYVDNEQLEENSDQLVINGIISPRDSIIRINVSRSQPLINVVEDWSKPDETHGAFYIKDARVTLSDGEREAELTYREEAYAYQSLEFYYEDVDSIRLHSYQIPAEEFPIEAGKTYTLKVHTPQGEEASASTTIPGEVPAFQLDTMITKTISEGCLSCDPNGVFILNMEWEDNPSTADTYQIIAEIETFAYYEYESHKDEEIYNITQVDYLTNPRFIGDQNLTGTQMKIRAQLNHYIADPLDTGAHFYRGFDKEVTKGEVTKNLSLSVMKINEDYQEYYNSLNAYYQTYQNPLAEPSPIYSNVEGGYGVFAGTNYTTRKIRLFEMSRD